MRNTVKRWQKVTVASAVAALGMTLTSTAPANALGTGNMTRSCGSNYIASGGGGGNFWAQTTKIGGSCQGILAAALQSRDGYISPKHRGTTQEAFTRIYNIDAIYGLHWGCDGCGVVLT
jgi:hypothetical protein